MSPTSRKSSGDHSSVKTTKPRSKSPQNLFYFTSCTKASHTSIIYRFSHQPNLDVISKSKIRFCLVAAKFWRSLQTQPAASQISPIAAVPIQLTLLGPFEPTQNNAPRLHISLGPLPRSTPVRATPLLGRPQLNNHVRLCATYKPASLRKKKKKNRGR